MTAIHPGEPDSSSMANTNLPPAAHEDGDKSPALPQAKNYQFTNLPDDQIPPPPSTPPPTTPLSAAAKKKLFQGEIVMHMPPKQEQQGGLRQANNAASLVHLKGLGNNRVVRHVIAQCQALVGEHAAMESQASQVRASTSKPPEVLLAKVESLSNLSRLIRETTDTKHKDLFTIQLATSLMDLKATTTNLQKSISLSDNKLDKTPEKIRNLAQSATQDCMHLTHKESETWKQLVKADKDEIKTQLKDKTNIREYTTILVKQMTNYLLLPESEREESTGRDIKQLLKKLGTIELSKDQILPGTALTTLQDLKTTDSSFFKKANIKTDSYDAGKDFTALVKQFKRETASI